MSSNQKRYITVSAWLKTAAAADAANVSGNTTIRDYQPDSDGRIGLKFGGAYTVDEVRALLRDLEHVQAAYDAVAYTEPKAPFASVKGGYSVDPTNGELYCAECDREENEPHHVECSRDKCPYCGKRTGTDGNGEPMRDDCIGAGAGW